MTPTAASNRADELLRDLDEIIARLDVLIERSKAVLT